MLARDVEATAIADGWSAGCPPRRELDLTDTAAFREVLERERPHGVINCAAFTAVDACESEEARALEVNGHAPGRAAEACAERGIPFVHVSSDYVFAGDADEPYDETAAAAPRSVYGRSKRLGEETVSRSPGSVIVRASWLFGAGGPSFVATMLRLADQGTRPLRVVDDQIGCPTYTGFLASALVALLRRARRRLADASTAALPESELFHYCNGPPVSWYDFARGVFEIFERDVDVVPVTTDEFPRPAPRPAYSVLATARITEALRNAPPGWRDGLVLLRRRWGTSGPGAQAWGAR